MAVRNVMRAIGKAVFLPLAVAACSIGNMGMKPQDAMPQPVENTRSAITDKENVAVAGLTEKYNITSISFNTRDGNIDMNFSGTSQLDSTREDGKNYASASGDKTVTRMSVLDDAFGTFGPRKADARIQIIELEYTDPNFSNRANIKVKVNVNKRTTPNMPLFVTNPSPQSDNPTPQFVDEIILEGKNISVPINGIRLGRDSRNLASSMISNTSPTRSEPNVGTRSVRIGWSNPIYRSVYPENGTVQLPPIQERITPN